MYEKKIWNIGTFAYFLDIPNIISRIKQRCRCNPKEADYVFTTTHKAKGLEWKTVVLLDDFLSIPNQDPDDCEYKLKDLERLPDDEKNLIYVALTRAKVRI